METLVALFRHQAWAMEKVLDRCETLPEDALAWSAKGVYGSILPTLVHIVMGEQLFLRLLGVEVGAAIRQSDLPVPDALRTPTQVEAAIRAGQLPTLAALRTTCTELAGHWLDLAARADTFDFTLPASPFWSEMPHAGPVPFLQAIAHGIEHRTNICTVLAAHGIESPRLDAFAYWQEMCPPSNPSA